MRTLVFLIPLILLASCAQSVCVDNLNLTQENLLAYENRPDTSGMFKVFDSSISVSGEVHELRIYDQRNGTYYVQFNPVRSFSEDWYGPLAGDPMMDIRCEQ